MTSNRQLCKHHIMCKTKLSSKYLPMVIVSTKKLSTLIMNIKNKFRRVGTALLYIRCRLGHYYGVYNFNPMIYHYT